VSDKRDDLRPAMCRHCRSKSEPRKLGRTPDGWSRSDGDNGFYFCPSCSVARKDFA
jgi:hypothetical protein